MPICSRRADAEAQSLKVEVQPPAQAALNFRLGKFDVELVPHGGGVEYVYDPARPESVLARSVADHALQAAAGSKPDSRPHRG